MSPKPSLLALFGCLGTIILFSLARLDLSRVPTNASYLEFGHSWSYSDKPQLKDSTGRELLAFIGVQVRFEETLVF